MRIKGAVLQECGRPGPWEQSQPIAVTELDLDEPGPGELLVRLEAAGVCHSDLSVVDGNRVRPVPMLLGHEACEIVLEQIRGARADPLGGRAQLFERLLVAADGTVRRVADAFRLGDG